MSEHEKRAAVNISQAVATAAAAGDAKVRRAYAAAVSRGANNTLCAAEQEREYGTLRLLTLASLRLPDLVLYGNLLEGICWRGSPMTPRSIRSPGGGERGSYGGRGGVAARASGA